MKKVAVVFGLAMSVAVPAGVWAADPGTTALAFLKLTTGARPLAMGGAFVGVADDVNSVYINPAGMGQLDGIQLQFTHDKQFQSINQEVLTYAQNFKDAGVVGVNVAALLVNGMDRTLATSTGDYNGTNGTFNAMDAAVTLAYARSLMNGALNLGIGAKALNEKIDTNNAFTFAADLGAYYKTPWQGLTAGVVLANLGAPIQQDPLPLTVKAGLGYKMQFGAPENHGTDAGATAAIADHTVLLALDGSVPVDNIPTISVGGEYSWRGMVAARLGFVAGPNLRDLGASTGLTGGIGFNFKMIGIDVGYQSFGDLGPTFRISLGARI